MQTTQMEKSFLITPPSSIFGFPSSLTSQSPNPAKSSPTSSHHDHRRDHSTPRKRRARLRPSGLAWNKIEAADLHVAAAGFDITHVAFEGAAEDHAIRADIISAFCRHGLIKAVT